MDYEDFVEFLLSIVIDTPEDRDPEEASEMDAAEEMVDYATM